MPLIGLAVKLDFNWVENFVLLMNPWINGTLPTFWWFRVKNQELVLQRKSQWACHRFTSCSPCMFFSAAGSAQENVCWWSKDDCWSTLNDKITIIQADIVSLYFDFASVCCKKDTYTYSNSLFFILFYLLVLSQSAKYIFDVIRDPNETRVNRSTEKIYCFQSIRLSNGRSWYAPGQQMRGEQ